MVGWVVGWYERIAVTVRLRLSCYQVFGDFQSKFFSQFQGNVKKNTKIGATNGSWGPLFHISFDLIIHSYVKGKGKQGWSSVLAFDKKPSIDLKRNGDLRFFFQDRKYTFISDVILNKWYNISIEQKVKNKKVRIK